MKDNTSCFHSVMGYLELWIFRFPLFVIHTVFSVAGYDNSTFSQNCLQKTCIPGLEYCMRKYGYMHVF